MSDGGAADSGAGDGGTIDARFTIFTLDPNASETSYLAMAVDPARQRVGVAYYTPHDSGVATDSGFPDYDLKYVEWRPGSPDGGAVTSAVETIRVVQRRVGLTLAFNPATGEPVAGYLGGVSGGSTYWLQSDAVLAVRDAGVWTDAVAAVDGSDTVCGNPVSDRGFLVGLWPALVFDPAGSVFFAWRDGHDGQFPQQDWAGSDVELGEGTLSALTRTCVNAGGNNKQAWGGHLQLALGAANQPAMVYDQMFGAADGTGANVIFQQRSSSGTWTASRVIASVANTQSGPSLAWDSQEGYGIAFVDRTTDTLSYVSSPDGGTWSSPDLVFGTGSGGWYPSLAMDPVNHEPAIAFYVCSPRTGVSETMCLASEDELRVSQRIANTWREATVDEAGGYSPKVGFFSSGKRLIAYRDPRSGVVKLAVER